MRYSTQIKPISYIKANAAEVLEKLSESSDPIIINQPGEAKAVLMDIRAYEVMQDTLMMLQIVAHGDQSFVTASIGLRLTCLPSSALT